MEVGMNTTKMPQEIKIEEGSDKQGSEVSTMEKDLNTIKSALTVSQRVAICFAAGVIGAAAGGPFRPPPVSVGGYAAIPGKTPGFLEIPQYYKTPLLGG